MAGKLDLLDKLNSDKVLVGYDLGDKYSQISYLSHASDAPETLSMTAGSENYNIPTVLCKRKGVNQWFYGKEACRYAQEQQGSLVENLVSLAREGKPVNLEGQDFHPIALLALFIKRSLSTLSGVTSLDKVEGIMFTSDCLDKNMVDVLGQVVGRLGLKTKNICFQGYVESIYYYMISQPEELWRYQVLVCDYNDDGMRVYRMECNNKTNPVVAFIEDEKYSFNPVQNLPMEEGLLEEEKVARDAEFLEILQETSKERTISSVYLIGEGFAGDWMKDSLRFICKNRRVFQGSNLYSKGACYTMREKQGASEIGKTHVFLGNEKLKSNIGMKVIKRGIDAYCPLLDAGVNWFEAKRELDFILESGDSFTILVTPLNGREYRAVEIGLEGMPDRPEKTTRLHLEVDMIGENKVQFRIEDRGFGELFPPTHMKWKEVLEI